MKKVLVLGGYGNFGKRIVEGLKNMENVVILVAGRSILKAQKFVDQLQESSSAKLEPCFIDILANDFEERLYGLSPDIVIHTSGPFQKQNYLVPEACAKANSHYVDLADDRRFVCDIISLDNIAKENNVLLVSGASSVPGLSSAVIDYYREQFLSIDSIDIAIAPGNKAERGEATVKAILSYTGHPLPIFKEGKWQDAYGWMDAKKVDFGDIVGTRWLANVDVPDLELFPNRYEAANRVSFQAGLELPFLHLSMVGMAYLVKKKLVKNWAPLSKPILKASELLMGLGSADGAMQIVIKGKDKQEHDKKIIWSLYAPNGIGPYIPTLSTIILAKKWLSADTDENTIMPGATPCVGQFNLEDFFSYFKELGIYHKEEHSSE